MEHLNSEGHINLQCEKEIEDLMRKIMDNHKPDKPMEWMALSQSVVSKVCYEFALTECSHRSHKIEEEQR